MSESTYTYDFILGRSVVYEGEPDGFESDCAGAPDSANAKWHEIERKRFEILSAVPIEFLKDATQTEATHFRWEYVLLFRRDRYRPTLRVVTDQLTKLPDGATLDAIGATLGVLGAREWYAWEGMIAPD